MGASGSGKSSLARHLREISGVRIIDTDDEILRLNGGVWPNIETKNALLPSVIDQACNLPNVILMNSYMPLALLSQLRVAGFVVVLLHVSVDELKRRQELRKKKQGWANANWIDWNEKEIGNIKSRGLIDRTISGEQDTKVIAQEILGTKV